MPSRRSFKILFSNALRIATTQIIATIITILAQLFIVLGCTAGCVLILSEVEYFSEGEGYVENPLVRPTHTTHFTPTHFTPNVHRPQVLAASCCRVLLAASASGGALRTAVASCGRLLSLTSVVSLNFSVQYPAILVFISSLFVSNCFMQVYTLAIVSLPPPPPQRRNAAPSRYAVVSPHCELPLAHPPPSRPQNTLLLSFCVDEDKYKKGLYKKKKDFNGEINGQMFCVLNKKAGLIALISGSAKDEMHEAEKAKAESDALAHGAQS